MKLIHSLKTGLSLLALVCALCSANFARAQLSFAVNINTSSIVNNAEGPFSLYFQSIFGSGSPQTITLSHFTFTGGSLLGSGTSFGAVSGNLSSSLLLNPNSSSFLNEFYQEFSPTVTDIRFQVDLTTNPSGATPTSFAVGILDNDLFNIPTTGLGDSLLVFNLNGWNVTRQVGVSTGATGGVSAVAVAIPEPSTYGLLAGVALLSAVVWRRRRLHRA